MHIVLGILWIALAGVWLSGIALITRSFDGYQQIIQLGQTQVLVMLTLMGVLCLIAAGSLIFSRRLQGFAVPALFVLTALHAFNAAGTYIFYTLNGRVGISRVPFNLMADYLPTRTAFLGMPTSDLAVFILPGATFVLWLLSLLLRPSAKRAPSLLDPYRAKEDEHIKQQRPQKKTEPKLDWPPIDKPAAGRTPAAPRR